MSYLSDTFGVPLKNQFTPPDTQVTPESLLAPQQPFGNLNAIGISTPNTPPYIGASQPPAMWPQPTQEDQYSYAPNTIASPTSVGSISPALSRLGVTVPQLSSQLSASELSQNPSTPGAIPAPAQLLDMPTRDQAKESKRLANMAGVGGVLGLLLGGGAGALQGASSAVQGGSQALDFAAQNQAQKVQAENQKRLQDAANERQVWADLSNEEQSQWQRKFQEEGLNLRNKAEVEKEYKARRDELQKATTELDRSRNDAWNMAKSLVGEDGKPLPQAKEIINAYNQRVLARAGVLGDATGSFMLDPDKVLPQGTTLKSATDVAKLSNTITTGKKLGLENEFLSQANDIKARLLNQKIDLNKAELGYKQIVNKYLEKNKELTNQQLQYVVSDLPRYLGLRDDALRSMIAERQVQTEKSRTSGDKIDPITLNRIKSTIADLDNWGKTAEGIRKANRIPNPAFASPEVVAKATAAQEKALRDGKAALDDRAKKLGIKVDWSKDMPTYDVPQMSRKVAIPTEPNHMAPNVPQGWGSWRNDWKPTEVNQFKALAKGEPVPFIKQLTGTPPKQNLNFPLDITSYGYGTDNNDPNSQSGVGMNDMRLQPGDVGLSRDVWNSLPPNLQPGSRVKVVFQKPDGTYMTGNFRLADKTAKEVNGLKLANRFDIYNPASDKPSPYDGGKVVYIQKADSESAKDITLKPVEKKPIAKPAPAKVQSLPSKKAELNNILKTLAGSSPSGTVGFGG